MMEIAPGKTRAPWSEGPVVRNMREAATERANCTQLLESLDKETQILIGELNELHQRLLPVLAERDAAKELISPAPSVASELGQSIARISNTIYGARAIVGSLITQLDL